MSLARYCCCDAVVYETEYVAHSFLVCFRVTVGLLCLHQLWVFDVGGLPRVLTTPWLSSTGELYQPSDCHLSSKLVPTFGDRGVSRS
jgi:hypothetical protein